MAQFGHFVLPQPYNEPLRDYAPNSLDAIRLQEACAKLRNEGPTKRIPVVVGGIEYTRESDPKGNYSTKEQKICSDKQKTLCTYHEVNKDLLERAVNSALEAKPAWEALAFEDRAAIFMKAADLLSTKYRYDVVAATMLGQGKTVWQAEIDAAAETIDFLRINPYFAQMIYQQQPLLNSRGTWNRVEYRPLEGFVVAISPFNFTAIGANLATAPALMGNVVIWKPASTAVLSNYIVYQALLEAGLPRSVIQFIPGSGALIGDVLLKHKDFAGLHFTGSNQVFNTLLKTTYADMSKYKSYPRMVGETGGKDFHFMHNSADVDNFVNNTVRSAFEYQGQKCSACSRAYVPKSLWNAKDGVRDKLTGALTAILTNSFGQPDKFENFMTAVIDEASFKNIKAYVNKVPKSKSNDDTKIETKIIIGKDWLENELKHPLSPDVGHFVPPIVIETNDKNFITMEEEIFGPVLTVFVYEDHEYEKTLRECDQTSIYALTGSIFVKDADAKELAVKVLRHSAGNFYINDKSTGAVVGQQPFGGARMSGTNDKAGSHLNLLRWVSPRTIKENFLPCNDWRHPHMATK